MNIRETQKKCHKIASDNGFNLGEHAKQILLIGSEVAEAIDEIEINKDEAVHVYASTLKTMMCWLEEERSRHNIEDTSTIKNKANLGEELADICIRVFSYAEAIEIDMQDEILRKMEINEMRPRLHGKEF